MTGAPRTSFSSSPFLNESLTFCKSSEPPKDKSMAFQKSKNSLLEGIGAISSHRICAVICVHRSSIRGSHGSTFCRSFCASSVVPASLVTSMMKYSMVRLHQMSVEVFRSSKHLGGASGFSSSGSCKDAALPRVSLAVRMVVIVIAVRDRYNAIERETYVQITITCCPQSLINSGDNIGVRQQTDIADHPVDLQ